MSKFNDFLHKAAEREAQIAGMISVAIETIDPKAIMRAAILEEALTWIGTPYHHEAKVKGAGADCAQFIIGVFQARGLLGEITIPHYAFQWSLHRSDELYLEELAKYCDEIEAPTPGDIVIWKIGRTFSHAALVIAWPEIVHSLVGVGVTRDNAELMELLKGRESKFLKPRVYTTGPAESKMDPSPELPKINMEVLQQFLNKGDF